MGSSNMKYLHHSQEVTIGSACTLDVKTRVVTVTGPRGTLVKNFKHLKVEMKQTGPRSILVEKWMGSSKDRAAVRTVCSHISNMSKVSLSVSDTSSDPPTLISPSTAPSSREATASKSETSWARSSSESSQWPKESLLKSPKP